MFSPFKAINPSLERKVLTLSYHFTIQSFPHSRDEIRRIFSIVIMPRGRVIEAESGSFDDLEEAAKGKHVKGCFFERGAHRCEKEIEKWLNAREEREFRYGEVAFVQVKIGTYVNDCDSDCKDPSCKNIDSERVASQDDIMRACSLLVKRLPESFREEIRKDAAALAFLSKRLCPHTPWLSMRLEIIQYNACWRWHQDTYVGRSIVTYVGPGTCTVDDKHVIWDAFERRSVDNIPNEKCVLNEKVKQMKTNAVLLMKGNAWPKISGKGLVHKSPEEGRIPPKRLILKVDLSNSPVRDISSDDDENQD